MIAPVTFTLVESYLHFVTIDARVQF